MVNRPSVPEIITVNSEVLQETIRDLLPSQNGFGSELQALMSLRLLLTLLLLLKVAVLLAICKPL